MTPNLTPRQRQVYALLLRGMSRREIADQLGFTVRTAKFHAWHVLHAYGCHTAVELMAARVAELEAEKASPKGEFRP